MLLGSTIAFTRSSFSSCDRPKDILSSEFNWLCSSIVLHKLSRTGSVDDPAIVFKYEMLIKYVQKILFGKHERRTMRENGTMLGPACICNHLNSCDLNRSGLASRSLKRRLTDIKASK